MDPYAFLDRAGRGGAGTPFALLYRPESGAPGAAPHVDLVTGPVERYAELADLPLRDDAARDRHELLVLVPYRQIAEQGFEHVDDKTPLLAMTVEQQAALPLAETLSRLPDGTSHPIRVRDGHFDLDDAEYAATVRRILDEEIGAGAGANFVLKRTFTAELEGWSVPAALALYARLLNGAPGQYWTFLVHLGERTLIGASPERHITLDRGTAVMNPISGTYRYPPEGPTAEGVLAFLADGKETNELYMVLDEELKMMSRVCEHGGQVIGPRLREMAHLAHTEYYIEGSTTRDIRDVLRETLLAPTVTGSPVESACRVIARFEPEGRGYYSGVAALIGRDAQGDRTTDSAILIRTADIDGTGTLRLGVGSTLVRDSDPWAESVETRAKAAGLLAALHAGERTDAVPPRPATGTRPGAAHLPGVQEALSARNGPLAPFWQTPPLARGRDLPALDGRRVLIIDAEDTFTAMGATLLRSLGCDVEVRRFDETFFLDGADLVIVGPGPGDPRDLAHPKIGYLHEVTGELLERDIPFLAVCLGHQVLSGLLGLPLVRKQVPHQGVQREIDLFGRSELVYFYNSFAAVSETDAFPGAAVRPGTVHVARDAATGEVHALRGPGFASVQFHPASVMTRNGRDIVGDLMASLLLTPRSTGEPVRRPRRDRRSVRL
ncbi:anthranilate synthase family protein [Streptomyces sp. NPDC005907]|uniref:anthranilate synthase family protein n=1 Tax=Streptomyces sp. NPDC005907 TaxID=3154571 RepID=UPI0033C18774